MLQGGTIKLVCGIHHKYEIGLTGACLASARPEFTKCSASLAKRGNANQNDTNRGRHWWLTPVLLVMWEAETRMILVQGPPGEVVCETSFPK
jgi:hypothetical protein